MGGLDRVYEINRNFRNEGVSTQHNPEFTMLEFYQAYANYHDLMDLTEELIKFVAMEVNGTTVLPSGEKDEQGNPIPRLDAEGQPIDLGKWERLTMREAVIKWWPADAVEKPQMTDFESEQALRAVLSRVLESVRDPHAGWRSESGDQSHSGLPDNLPHGSFGGISSADQRQFNQNWRSGAVIHVQLSPALEVLDKEHNLGKAIATLFESIAEHRLIQPTIIYEFPTAVSPLSKQKPDEPDWVERFEIFAGGFELGNAFSELNDPVEQHKRFEQQLAEKACGDDEAHAMDEDYVRALAYGLPPTGGEGIGIDRLVMLLTGSKSIRDVILFPLMRKTGNEGPSHPSEQKPFAGDPGRDQGNEEPAG